MRDTRELSKFSWSLFLKTGDPFYFTISNILNGPEDED